MENFLLIRKKVTDNEFIKASFEKHFPASSGIFRNFKGCSLYLFKKGCQFPDNFYEKNNSFIGAIGTLFYKGLSYSESLVRILIDELSGTLELDKLLGHFYIFIWNGDELKIYNDGSGIIKAYYDTELKFFSSSFLVLTEVFGKSLTLNKDAILENIFTGGITGEDTILKEIKGVEPGYENKFGEIRIISPQIEIEKSNSKEEALEKQISIISNYFSSLHNLTIEYGADIGLTGGLDSRLLLGFARKYLVGYHVHSHFRSETNKDLEIARQIAIDQSVPFISPEVVYWSRKNEEEKKATFKEAFIFCDGQAREYCLWHEEYNSVNYVKKVLNGKGLSLSGIGGEQYRNGERAIKQDYSFEKWIHGYLGKFAGLQIYNNPVIPNLVSYISGKICKMLGFQSNIDKVNLYDLKRISNEVLIPSYRSIRINSENRLAFSLSPFADFKLSHVAYDIIPFLNHTYNFEIDILRMIAPNLSAYNSTYGYSFEKKEPISSYFKSILIKNYIPDKVFLTILEYKKSNRLFYEKRIYKEKFLQTCIDNIKEINLDLNIESILQNANTSNMLLSLGFIVGELKGKLR